MILQVISTYIPLSVLLCAAQDWIDCLSVKSLNWFCFMYSTQVFNMLYISCYNLKA